MELGGSMPHSQGLSNNSYPEPNQHILKLSGQLRVQENNNTNAPIKFNEA